MLDFVQNYGLLIFGVVVFLALVGYVIYLFVKQPQKIKEWLIWACAQAEIKLGSKTGQLKLREVYNMFIMKFPIVAKFITFETFQSWTEESLSTLQEWIENNEMIKNFIYKDTEDENNEE